MQYVAIQIARSLYPSLAFKFNLVFFCSILYITDWGNDPSIFSIDLSSGVATVIVSGQLQYPNGLGIDFQGVVRIFLALWLSYIA